MTIIRKRIYNLSTIILILASFTMVSLISKSAECAMLDSQMILPTGKVSLREINEEKGRSMLENKIVAERLRSFGLSKNEVMAKMAQMSDGQIHQLSSLLDRLPAGGASGLFIATTTIILVAIIVVLIIILVAVG